MILDILEIQKIIPHRYPFLMIDKVIECAPNKKLIAIKNVSNNEQFFQGHFPGEKIMPGGLIIEAMTQAGCVYFYYSKDLQGKDLVYHLAKIDARFHHPVVPGDQLRIEVSSVKLLPKTGIIRAEVRVGDKLVAEAEIGLGIKEV